MSQPLPRHPHISKAEYNLLLRLRDRPFLEQGPQRHPPSLGQRVADRLALVIGSWTFIIIQSVVLTAWVVANVAAYSFRWDPYPFILLNLMLSFQAAYAAPIILMSQNRQAELDRAEAQHDYQVNARAELEIELLHDKLDVIREQDFPALREMLVEQSRHLSRLPTQD